MSSSRITIGSQDLLSRIRSRLLGVTNTQRQAIWQIGTNQILVHGETVVARLLSGWLLVSVELESDQTGKSILEFVYFVGSPGEADGNSAAVRINAATPEATQLAEVLGADLQRVIWDAVLDTIEVSLRKVHKQFPNQSLTLRGFQASPEGLLVDVFAGEI